MRQKNFSSSSLTLFSILLILGCNKSEENTPVNPPQNHPPVAAFTVTPTEGGIDTEFQFDAKSSSDQEDSLPELFRWNFKGDSIWSTQFSASPVISYQYATPGTYRVTLVVKDSDGTTDTTSRNLNVLSTPPTPRFTISPPNGNTNTVFEFDASASTDLEDNLNNLLFRWDWESDGSWNTEFTHDPSAGHRFLQAGLYSITLQVKNSTGAFADSIRQLIVSDANNQPPIASFTVDPPRGDTTTIFTFNATSTTDPDNQIGDLFFRWDWDSDGIFDADSGNNPIATHKFDSPGALWVSLQVWDSSFNISSTGNSIVVEVFLYDLERTLTEHSDEVNSVAFNPDGSLLASGSWGSIKLWQSFDGTLVKSLNRQSLGSINSIKFNTDGSFLGSGGWDNNVSLWNVSDGTLLRTQTGHSDEVNSVAFSPDGTLLASASDDNSVKLWRVYDGTLLQTLRGHTGWVNSVAFNSDGTLLASGSDDWTVVLWRVSDGTSVRTLTRAGFVKSVAFSPNGLVLAGGGDGIKLWQISDGALIKTLTGDRNGVTSVAFSPDGSQLASGSNDHDIKLWRVSDWALLQTLNGHSNSITSVAFSPNGTILASGSDDHTIKIWRRR